MLLAVFDGLEAGVLQGDVGAGGVGVDVGAVASADACAGAGAWPGAAGVALLAALFLRKESKAEFVAAGAGVVDAGVKFGKNVKGCLGVGDTGCAVGATTGGHSSNHASDVDFPWFAGLPMFWARNTSNAFSPAGAGVTSLTSARRMASSSGGKVRMSGCRVKFHNIRVRLETSGESVRRRWKSALGWLAVRSAAENKKSFSRASTWKSSQSRVSSASAIRLR